MDIVREVRIANASGLHARPCSAFVTLAGQFESDLRVTYEGHEVNGKSILELMTLGAPEGATLLLRAAGADAERQIDSLAELVQGRFGEGH